ncbi:hypothetical protein [Eisenibacter elegans]|jgi:hypothetical protein|uniref:hypothetical protein n=1 Tax=Eisenibacter elegans TaxID=997 RepID=UPI00040C3108|nr:hypothetical protein [Eisenibacter elegans]
MKKSISPLFQKLNFKNHPAILALYAPESMSEELAAISAHTPVHTQVAALEEIAFALVFVTTQETITQTIEAIAPKLVGDAVLWFCYPKGTSKKYRCDFNRDTGWEVLGQYELEGVRQVAIDENWSALRFRKVAYIKTLSRTKLKPISESGRKKAAE